MKSISKKERLARRGAVLAFVLSILIIFFLTGLGLLSLSFHGQLRSIRTGAEIMARSAADAGLIMGLFRMNEKLNVQPWDDSTLPQESQVLPNSAIYGFAVEKINDVYAIRSTGRRGIVTRTVRAELRVAGLFDDPIFVEESLELGAKTIVDGYNSEDGPYGGTNSLKRIVICSNATANVSINLAHADTVYGDVIVGVDADPAAAVLVGDGHVTGDIYAGQEPRELEQIVPPSWLTPKPVSDIEGTKTLGPANSGSYSGAALAEGTLTIAGHVTLHIKGVVELGDVAFVISDAVDSSLTLYADQSFIGDGGPFVEFDNLPKNPAKLQIYGTGSSDDPDVTYQIGSPKGFYGAIYAPNANIELNGEFYGAFVGNSITQPTPGDIHCDEALKDMTPVGPGAHFVISRWWEE